MVHHFAKWMASPQFTHPQVCDDSCQKEHTKEKESIFEKLLKGIGKK
jgi:hypothetical protein